MKTTIAKILYDGHKEEVYIHFYECQECKGHILDGNKYCSNCGKKIRRFEGTQN